MPFDQMPKHIEEDCGRTMVAAPFAARTTLVFTELLLQVTCPIGCKGVKKVLGGDPITYVNKFRRNEIDKHCADHCPQRDVNCYNYPGCKYAMKAHERCGFLLAPALALLRPSLVLTDSISAEIVQ